MVCGQGDGDPLSLVQQNPFIKQTLGDPVRVDIAAPNIIDAHGLDTFDGKLILHSRELPTDRT